jgi:adenylate kinase family enzyme
MGELIRQNVTGKVTLNIVDKTLAAIDTKTKECVFEGNPRSIPQAQWWLEQIAQGRFDLKGVLHLVVDHQIAQDRMEKRGRVDDENEEVIKKRFDEYHRSITPTLDYLENHGVSVYEIDASGTIEEVAENIHKTLGI